MHYFYLYLINRCRLSVTGMYYIRRIWQKKAIFKFTPSYEYEGNNWQRIFGVLTFVTNI